MKKKTAIVLLISGLLLSFGGVLGANWYESTKVRTESITWLVTINSIPAYSTQYENVDLTGTVSLGGVPQPNIDVYLMLDINETGTFTNLGIVDQTDGSGNWLYAYNNTEPSGSILEFKAAIQQ